jgi:hypothetical protein
MVHKPPPASRPAGIQYLWLFDGAERVGKLSYQVCATYSRG